MMMRELITSTPLYQDEFVRRHGRHPKPAGRPRGELKRAIGHGLIHLGERMTRVEQASQLDEAA